MAGVDLVTVKELMGHVGIAMTVRYSHLVPEHKAQAVTKLSERFEGFKKQQDAPSVVSPELKVAINADSPLNLPQNRNVFLMRAGRGLKIVSNLPSDSKVLGRGKMWPGTESNRRHGDFQSPALPTELPGRKK
jgi:hypothetical protein